MVSSAEGIRWPLTPSAALPAILSEAIILVLHLSNVPHCDPALDSLSPHISLPLSPPLQVAHESLHLHILPAVGGASGEWAVTLLPHHLHFIPAVCWELCVGNLLSCMGGSVSCPPILGLPQLGHEHMLSHWYYAGVGESLVEAAQKLQATLLVLGTRGMGSVKRCVASSRR